MTSRVVFRVTARRAGVCPLFSLPSTCQCQSQARRWASKTWNTWQGHVPVLGVCRSNKEVAQTPECFHLTGRGLPVSFTHIPSGWEGRCICNIFTPPNMDGNVLQKVNLCFKNCSYLVQPSWFFDLCWQTDRSAQYCTN